MLANPMLCSLYYITVFVFCFSSCCYFSHFLLLMFFPLTIFQFSFLLFSPCITLRLALLLPTFIVRPFFPFCVASSSAFHLILSHFFFFLSSTSVLVFSSFLLLLPVFSTPSPSIFLLSLIYLLIFLFPFPFPVLHPFLFFFPFSSFFFPSFLLLLFLLGPKSLHATEH